MSFHSHVSENKKKGTHKMKLEQLLSISRDVSIDFIKKSIELFAMFCGVSSNELIICIILLYIANLLWGIIEITGCKKCTLLDIFTIKGKLFGILIPPKAIDTK